MTDTLINAAFLMALIGICEAIRSYRLKAEAAALHAEAEQAKAELQQFALLWNYGATEEAFEHLRECGFKTADTCQNGQSV